MKLYRCVPRASHSDEKVYHRLETLRTPSHVPYLVDNLWEALRPMHMPSRRHAAYASPSAQQAFASAATSGDGSKEATHVVCEVLFEGEFKVAHLSVEDAKYHPDVAKLPKVVRDVLGADFANQPFEVRQALAPLFMPWLRAEELEQMANTSPLVAQILTAVSQSSTFWPSAQPEPNPESQGELFFEPSPGARYRLVAQSFTKG